MSELIAALVSRRGFLFTLPFTRVYGNPDVMLDRPLFGFYRVSQYGGRYNWEIHIGRRSFSTNPPGDQINEEVLDPPSQRVTVEVPFRGQTYTYHSGHRVSYWKNFPLEREEVAVWIPDEKHSADKRICSVGITSKNVLQAVDIAETLELVFSIGED